MRSSPSRSPRRFASLTVLACAALCVRAPAPAHAQSAAPATADRAVTNVHVVDVARGTVLRDRTLLIADGRIQDVVRSEAGPARAAEVVDGGGAYVIPGLLDAHAHVLAGGMPDRVSTEWLLPLTLAHGVTGVRDMASDCDLPDESQREGPSCLEKMKGWQTAIEAGELLGPRLLGLSSFPLNPPWGHQTTRAQVAQVVGAFAEQGIDHIKIYYRLSPEAFGMVMEEAKRHGIAVAGHIPLRMTAASAAAAGLTSMEHARDFLFDCFPGSAAFRSSAQGQSPTVDVMRAMVEDHDAAACDEAFRTFVAHGTWYVPTHVTRRMDAYADDEAFRTDPRSRYIPAPLWQAWQKDADRMVALAPTPEGRAAMRGFYELGLELTGRAHDAGVRIALGTDAGDTYVFPGSGAHDELAELVKAGLTPAEALRAGTLDAAELMGVADRFGSVAPGKAADLVLLAADPLEDIAAVREIRGVVFRGEWLDRTRLDAMLEGAEAVAHALGGTGR